MEERIKTAVKFLEVGQAFKVGDLMLDAKQPGVIEVIGWSVYTNFSNLTKKQCLRELKEIKDLFLEMVDTSQELKEFIKNRVVKFSLYFDDYGKGSIWLCTETENEVIWEGHLK